MCSDFSLNNKQKERHPIRLDLLINISVRVPYDRPRFIVFSIYSNFLAFYCKKFNIKTTNVHACTAVCLGSEVVPVVCI